MGKTLLDWRFFCNSSLSDTLTILVERLHSDLDFRDTKHIGQSLEIFKCTSVDDSRTIVGETSSTVTVVIGGDIIVERISTIRIRVQGKACNGENAEQSGRL